MEFRAKTVAESRVETVHIIRPADLNDAGRLFGGVLMQWIDEVAALVAKRHSQMNVTTASVDNLRFLQGAFQRDVIVIIGRVTHVGNTSMEVKVETYVEHTDGKRDLINRAFLTEIGLGEITGLPLFPALSWKRRRIARNGSARKCAAISGRNSEKRAFIFTGNDFYETKRAAAIMVSLFPD